MTKKQSKNANVNEPSLCLAVAALDCTLYVQAVILRNLILTLRFHIVLARLCMGITAHFWCQMKEEELNFVTMKTILYKFFNFSGKITALSGVLFIGTHCILTRNTDNPAIILVLVMHFQTHVPMFMNYFTYPIVWSYFLMRIGGGSRIFK